jgi:hypothetical protein
MHHPYSTELIHHLYFIFFADYSMIMLTLYILSLSIMHFKHPKVPTCNWVIGSCSFSNVSLDTFYNEQRTSSHADYSLLIAHAIYLPVFNMFIWYFPIVYIDVSLQYIK